MKKAKKIDKRNLREHMKEFASKGELSKVTTFDIRTIDKIPSVVFKYARNNPAGKGINDSVSLTLEGLAEALKKSELMFDFFHTLSQPFVCVSEDILNFSSRKGQKVSEYNEGLTPEEMKKFAILMST